jgi:pilus assembly protein CpaB
LLQNVRVLAVDQLADDRTEEPAPAKAVTIEVTTEQAQKLMLASSVGQLALALRSAGSTSDEASRRIAVGNLNSSSSAPSSSSSTAMVVVTREITRSDYSVPRADQQLSN